jgi:hypothetical protein
MALVFSNFGKSVRSIRGDGSLIGIGTTCMDNVYQVLSNQVVSTQIAGIGSTNVTRIYVGVASYNGFNFNQYPSYTFDTTAYTFDSTGTPTFDSTFLSDGEDFFGMYSWGRIAVTGSRTSSKSFTWYNQNGVSGISSSPIVRRINPLKYRDYNL